ncbi:hypothetical protein [Spiribacter onubensis]|uniref:Uncharacterized protein n=1 Tax=Spiribacter onubensis TaxID=3122420 RepID=A0ABV3S9V0_9GAMM
MVSLLPGWLGSHLAELDIPDLAGHDPRNLETSRTIYGQSWRDVVEAPLNHGRLLATGYSCRSQVRRLSGRELPHPLQGLLALIRETHA